VQDSPEEQNSEVVDQGQVTETDNPIPQESLTPRRPIFKKPICKKSRPTGNDEKSRADEAYAILKSSTKRDDFSIYGEHVGNELRKLQPTAQIYVKHAINNILFQAATYGTRKKSNLCLKELRLNKSQTGVLFYGIKFYNKLPEVVRNASVDNFKINIKKFLLKKAYYSFEDFLRDTIDTLN
jgi:hypothetical protein